MMDSLAENYLREIIDRQTAEINLLQTLCEKMQSQNDSFIECTNDTITELVRLLRLAVNDIDRLINVSCVIKCADIIGTNYICFMGGTLQGRNTWIHQKEAEEILKEFQEESEAFDKLEGDSNGK